MKANKIDLIKAEVERLQNELIQEKEKGYGSDTDDACILELQNVLTYIDSLQEETESEDLEKVSKKYSSCIYLEEVLSDDDKEVLKGRLINTFKAGAEWQKLKDMGITNNAKGVVTNILNSSDKPLDIYATEVAFIMLPANLTENYHMTNRDRISDAVRLGAKWQEKQDQSTIELAEDHAMLAGIIKGTEHTIGKVRSILNKVAYENNGLDVNGDYCEQPYVELDNQFRKLLKEE